MVGEVAIASYWWSVSGFGSSLFRGSSCVESSGTYGHFKDVRGRRVGGSSRLSDDSAGQQSTWVAGVLLAGASGLGLRILFAHVSVCCL